MERRQGRSQRKGQIYRFTIDGTDYAAFVWKAGAHFRGRVEDHPQVPEQKASTSLAVREALHSWLVTTAKSS